MACAAVGSLSRGSTTMAARLWMLGALVVATQALTCDRAPEGRRYSDKTPSDGRYYLEMFEDPTTYTPNTAYTISLKAQVSAAHHRFIGFLLVAEGESDQTPVGTFQITDFLTKYSDRCPNAVTNTNYQPKTEIQSLWTAPPPGSGCITLKVTVIVHHDIWHMDDPSLSKTLCENDIETSDADASIIDPCCACDEAKYEVTFEGLWSRHTHPKDFPSNGWLTRFSDVIGASHAADYRFWEYGQHASEGLRQLAEHGATKVLESELKAESDHIRTIIKARGISYPNLTGKTFAVFRVDNRHHLMSLVSMIDPSPDWIVGVSGLELCLRNCTWVESKVIKLYPWDAGTDSGPTYISPDQPTTPRDVIRKIGTNYPNDPRSPFYDPSGKEMKPLARLILSRQRLYEKSCDGSGTGTDSTGSADPCAVSGWGPWTPCTVTCGKGKKYRHRNYRNSGEADSSACNVPLTLRETCWGPRRHCNEDDNTRNCPVTEWSDWSPCTAECGIGFRIRSRQKIYQKMPIRPKKRVTWSLAVRGIGDEAENMEDNEEMQDEEEEEEDENNSTDGGDPCVGIKLSEEVTCHGTQTNCNVSAADSRLPTTNIDSGSLTLCKPPVSGEITGAGITGDGSVSGYDALCNPLTEDNNQIIVSQEPTGEVKDCKVSEWSVWTKCKPACGKGFRQKSRHIFQHPYNGGKQCPSLLKRKPCKKNKPCRKNEENNGSINEFDSTQPTWGPGDNMDNMKIDCILSEWSPWSPCSETCGLRSFRQRTKYIMSPPAGGGEPCAERVQKKNCDLMPCPHY